MTEEIARAFSEKSAKTDFSAFLSTFLGLVDFSGYFGILAVFDKNRSFLYHGQDLLKFGFSFNLTAGFGTISFKKSGGAKTAFIAFQRQVEILEKTGICKADFQPLSYRGTLF